MKKSGNYSRVFQSGLLKFALMLVVVGTGCSAPANVRVDEVEATPQGPTTWAEVERTDVTAYKEESVVTDRTITHDVPSSLMSNSADKGLVETVDGFRIQVFASEVRDEAVQAEEQIRLWIRSLSEQRRNVLGLKKEPSVYSFYKQPYYRVRMGDFETRAQAQPVLSALKSRFTGALIVPDTIQIQR